MSKTLIVLLLLAVGTLSYNDPRWDCGKGGCKPAAVKVDNCNDPLCYRCGVNQVFNYRAAVRTAGKSAGNTQHPLVERAATSMAVAIAFDQTRGFNNRTA